MKSKTTSETTAMGKKAAGAQTTEREAVNEAVANLISAVESKGTLTLKHIWSICWGTLSVALVGQIATVLIAFVSFGGTVGWLAHMSSLALFPEPSPPVATVNRVPMPDVLSARTEFISDKAADWMYPLVRMLEESGQGERRTTFQVSAKLDKPTTGSRIQVIKSGNDLAGFAFLVRQHEDRQKSYQPLPRVAGTNPRFIVEVPDANAGDEIVVLTALSGTFKKSELEGLFSIRRSP